MNKLYGIGILILYILSSTVSAYTNTDIIYAQALAKNGIIVDHSADPENYRFDDAISRAELVGIALKIRGTKLPEEYACKKYFSDVSINDWVCAAIEFSADAGLISRERNIFNPSKSISKSEALSILMKSMGITIDPGSSREGYAPDVVQWQINLLESALKHNIISSAQDFNPNRPAKRADVFNMAVSIAISVSKIPATTRMPDMDISLSTIGDNREWASQYSGGNASGHIDMLTPNGETIENWKELITRRVDFILEKNVETFAETWKNGLIKMDANITVSLEPKASGALIATYASEKLNERGIAKFFEGTDGVYMILYSAKFKNYNIQHFKTWSKNIRSAELLENTLVKK